MKRYAIALVVWLAAVATSIAALEEPVPVGLRKQLFVDGAVSYYKTDTKDTHRP